MEFTFMGKPMRLSRAAMNELYFYGYDMYDIQQVLELGYDCARSKRSNYIIEKCLDKKGKVLKVVLVDSYDYSAKCEVWVVVHFGLISKPRS